MFNKVHASSGVKKAAYRAGWKGNWKYEPLYNTEPWETYVILHHRGKTLELTGIEIDLAQDYTWEEIRR